MKNLPRLCYVKYGAVYYVQPVFDEHGRRIKQVWHRLCPASAPDLDILQAYITLRKSLQEATAGCAIANSLQAWITAHIDQYSPKVQREYRRMCGKLAEAFADFGSVAEITPADVAAVRDQWRDNPRSANMYLTRINVWLAWECERGTINVNPCREVRRLKEHPVSPYISDDDFRAALRCLITGDDGRPTQSGPVVSAIAELTYLTGQRITEIRLMRIEQIRADALYFRPSKTARSSGRDCCVEITPDIRAVLDAALAARAAILAALPARPLRDDGYLFLSREGKPYAANGIRSAWVRACRRAGISNVTLEGLRSKALTDASMAGQEIDELSEIAAHTSQEMTRAYIKRRLTPRQRLKVGRK